MEKLLLGLMTAAKKLRHYFESHHIIVCDQLSTQDGASKTRTDRTSSKWSIYLSGFDIEFKPKTAIKSQVLADFVAEFSPGLEPTTCDEVVMISDNKPWILYLYSIRCEFKATNNEAEYEALIAGLDIALRLGAKQLHHDQLPEDKMEARRQGPKLQDIQFLKTNFIEDPRQDFSYDASQVRYKSIKFSKKCTTENVGIMQGAEVLLNESHDKVYYWPTLREDAITSMALHAMGDGYRGKITSSPRTKVYLLVSHRLLLEVDRSCCFLTGSDKEVISFIQKNIIYRFGVPAEIMCDNGSQFISDKTRTFCEKRGIKLITSTPRYPQSNGLAESSNKVIINSIRKRLKGAKGKWVEELPSVLWANLLPIEAQLPIARSRMYDQNAINLSYDLDAFEELREKALRTMAAQKGIVEKTLQIKDLRQQKVWKSHEVETPITSKVLRKTAQRYCESSRSNLTVQRDRSRLRDYRATKFLSIACPIASTNVKRGGDRATSTLRGASDRRGADMEGSLPKKAYYGSSVARAKRKAAPRGKSGS
ncbi:hypothetical protein OSB04_017176 [Centaurea solstitialis]|uniref:Integrase catalytic domain-containing protein n=1 Tax=Centaurea solstitialis TaxID=347529 RepID=A0AA38WLS9_9ASTR|nr:hypothetical protein OSB04_017176 [Centaurea solstitialis]